MNFDLFNIDLSHPVDCFVKTCTFLAVGTSLEFMSGFPPLLMDFAKFFAYLGASIAFWKFTLSLLMPSRFKKEDK
jgi:hypothetical protein